MTMVSSMTIAYRYLAKLRAGTVMILATALNVVALQPANAQQAAGKIEGQIEFGFWGNAKRAELAGQVARGFESAHPGVKVQQTVAEFVAFTERLTVQAAASDLPCVTQTQSTFLSSFAKRGAFEPLDDLVKSGALDVSGIPHSVLETARIDGKLYMVPTGLFMRLNLYNAAMAQQNGISEPPQRGTFGAYKQWLLDAQKKLPAGVYAAENQGGNLYTLYSWVAGHGQTFFDEKGALAIKPELLARYFEYWEELRKAGAATPADQLDEVLATPDQTPLARGKALTNTRDIPQLDQVRRTLANANLPSDVKFFANPVEPDALSGNVPGTNGLSIAKNCENVPTAAAFIDYFSNDPSAAVTFQSNNGVVISEKGRAAVLADAKMPAAIKESVNSLSSILDRKDVIAASYPSGYQSLTSLLRRSYESVALKGQKPADAAEQFFREASRSLR
jgi:multiple sugar transport system substrate-binding protein